MATAVTFAATHRAWRAPPPESSHVRTLSPFVRAVTGTRGSGQLVPLHRQGQRGRRGTVTQRRVAWYTETTPAEINTGDAEAAEHSAIGEVARLERADGPQDADLSLDEGGAPPTIGMAPRHSTSMNVPSGLSAQYIVPNVVSPGGGSKRPNESPAKKLGSRRAMCTRYSLVSIGTTNGAKWMRSSSASGWRSARSLSRVWTRRRDRREEHPVRAKVCYAPSGRRSMTRPVAIIGVLVARPPPGGVRFDVAGHQPDSHSVRTGEVGTEGDATVRLDRCTGRRAG